MKRPENGGVWGIMNVGWRERGEIMAELVGNCPRCGTSSITFDVNAANYLGTPHYSWEQWHEVFAICRRCRRTTVFVVKDRVEADYDYTHKVGLLSVPDALNQYVEVSQLCQHEGLGDCRATGASSREGGSCLQRGGHVRRSQLLQRRCSDVPAVH